MWFCLLRNLYTWGILYLGLISYFLGVHLRFCFVAPEISCVWVFVLCCYISYALILGKDFWKTCVSWWSYRFLLRQNSRHKLWFLFASCWACDPICYVSLVCWDDMLCTIHIDLKTMLMIISHSWISLIICFAMYPTHTILGWVFFLSGLTLLLLNHWFVASDMTYFLSICSLAHILCSK